MNKLSPIRKQCKVKGLNEEIVKVMMQLLKMLMMK